MKYGRIKNGVVVDIATDPKNQFHPILAAEFVEIPDDVGAGYTFDGTNYTAPEFDEDEIDQLDDVSGSIKISPIEFKLLFNVNERVKIKEIRAKDDILDDFYAMLDDPRLTVIDLSKRTIVEAVNYTFDALENAGVVSEENKETRIFEVLGGQDVDA
ncbi:hypothetical protein [Marinomonas sp. 2405UD68-3]|uniref:hypothetical protein n=1 Tax=Marinomonas sp. 2405UD68-3 TaxID=3391835 RepID=UPI0039C90960